MKKKSLSMLLIVSLVLCQTACGRSQETTTPTITPTSEATPTVIATNPPTKAPTPEPTQKPRIEPFSDVRVWMGNKVIKEDEYNLEDLNTFWMDKTVTFVGHEEEVAKIMEDGKNPGLGVRKLHEEGITGKGVNVAIIDQNMYLDHPEYKDKIAAYKDLGCNANEGSMHGPGVASLLVGETIGVAPDARLYFAAAPGWTGDTSYEANALYWIIEENKKLPEGQKIRVVSVSAAPSGPNSPREKNLEQWDEAVLAAEAEGMLVLDCGSVEGSHFIRSAFFDPNDREDPAKCCGGYPLYRECVPEEYICAPTCYRTTAEEYVEGKCGYQYSGQGGLSWGIPYIAGVLAMGWQLNPDLSNDEIIKILFDTRTQGKDGSYIVNPPAFVEEVKKTVK